VSECSEVFLGDQPRENGGGFHCFGDCLCLHHQPVMVEADSLKCWKLTTL
jgi:hypothetical protein